MLHTLPNATVAARTMPIRSVVSVFMAQLQVCQLAAAGQVVPRGAADHRRSALIRVHAHRQHREVPHVGSRLPQLIGHLRWGRDCFSSNKYACAAMVNGAWMRWHKAQLGVQCRNCSRSCRLGGGPQAAAACCGARKRKRQGCTGLTSNQNACTTSWVRWHAADSWLQVAAASSGAGTVAGAGCPGPAAAAQARRQADRHHCSIHRSWRSG